MTTFTSSSVTHIVTAESQQVVSAVTDHESCALLIFKFRDTDRSRSVRRRFSGQIIDLNAQVHSKSEQYLLRRCGYCSCPDSRACTWIVYRCIASKSAEYEKKSLEVTREKFD